MSESEKEADQLTNALLYGKTDEELRQALKVFKLIRLDQALRNFHSLAEDPLGKEEFKKLLPCLVLELKNNFLPDDVLNFFERLASNVSSRSKFYSFLEKDTKVLSVLFRVFSTSPFLAEVLIRHPEYLEWLFDPRILNVPWMTEDFQKEIDSVMSVIQSWPFSLNTLRRFKRRHMLRIGVRDLAGYATLEETTRDISVVADICLEWAYRIAYRELKKKYGEPYSEKFKGDLSKFAVIGMGKLGGLELNYSSDIDVIFIYSDEGSTVGEKITSIDNNTFFTRLAEKILEVMGTRTREGYLYRVDIRLRPEGDTGPLVRSLASYELYYSTWGQTWERQALIKARCVAGDQTLGKTFLTSVKPFVFRRYMDYEAIQEMRSIKIRIEKDVDLKGNKYRDVKLGEGGIREVEFGIQILQLLYGGKIESLRRPSSLKAIEALSEAKLLDPEMADQLKESYIFLRRVEHLLQLEQERQTHVLPEDPKKLEQIAWRLNYSAPEDFIHDYEKVTHQVHEFYESVFSGLMSSQEPVQKPLSALLETGKLSDSERLLLGSVGFKDLEATTRNLLSLVRGQDYMNVSQETRNDFISLIPVLLNSLKKSFDPDQALIGLERFVSSYKARSALFNLLRSSSQILELLVMLFGLSPFLTEILVRNPDYFDVIIGGSLNNPMFMEEKRADLEQILAGEADDFETKLLTLRDFKNLQVLRLGLRDTLRLSPYMEIFEALSLLAEGILKNALELSRNVLEEKCHEFLPPFVVVGLGKFGGQELGYASDLDIVFISSGDQDRVQQINSLASMLIDVLSRNMMGGFLYKIDTRLRPDGEKGALVQSLEGYKSYYVQSNSIWERMALSRARIVAGDEDMGKEVMSVIDRFVFQSPPSSNQVQEIKSIREKIFRERCKGLPPGFDVKSGQGGLLDIEFLAQFLQLKLGDRLVQGRETHTLKLLQKLSYHGLLSREDFGLLVEAYLYYREIEGALRLVKDRSVDFIPKDSLWAIRIQKKMGVDQDPDYFFEKINHLSKVVRYIYDRYMET